MGFMTAPPTRPPRAQGKRAAGPGRTPGGQAVEGERVPNPRHPSRRHEMPLPPKVPLCRFQRAQLQLARACAAGLVTGPQACTPRARWGLRSAQHRTPLTVARGAPARAPSCRPNSAQPQLARACDVGVFVTVPPAPIPPARNEEGQPAPAAPLKSRRSGGGEWPIPDTPHRGTSPAPPTFALPPPPPRRTPARKSGRCGVGDGPARLHPLHPRKTASRPRLHAPGTGNRGPLPVFLGHGGCRCVGRVPERQAVRVGE